MNRETTDKKIDNLTQVVVELSKTMVQGFKDAEVRTDSKIDELARITSNGFISIQNEMNERFDKVDENFKEVNMKLHDMDQNISRNTNRIEKLEENVGIL